MNSPFRVAVINDEISQDFGHACEVASREFGMEWIELRGMWNKNLLKLDAKEVEEARRILEKNKLRVTDIASPLFKVDWPGAPKSKYSPKRDQFNADFTFEQQDEVLERSIELAKAFHTDRVRFFDFWRLDDQARYRTAINEKLRNAAEAAPKKDVILVLVKKPDGKTYAWAAMGQGIIDWAGQFSALKRDGYHFAVSLETHWRAAGTPEESTRQSWAGMKKELQEAGAI
ncbi:MAG: sugar phosphate isomerase [Acidobacteria bacterium]|nr:MAG: sugar phosphate isomerase [Acidobacteriota bacterium]